MPALRTTVAACVALLASCSGLNPAHASEGKADVVLRTGKIYTADSTRSIAQAIAFTGNTILAVGNDEDMVPLIGAKTQTVDLQGKLVLPGMIDTHIHPIFGSRPLDALDDLSWESFASSEVLFLSSSESPRPIAFAHSDPTR